VTETREHNIMKRSVLQLDICRYTGNVSVEFSTVCTPIRSEVTILTPLLETDISKDKLRNNILLSFGF